MFNVYLITAIILKSLCSSYCHWMKAELQNSQTTPILRSVSLLLLNDHEGSMIFVFLGPCTLISENLCRLCHGSIVSASLFRKTTHTALHTIFVQQSLVILLLSFAYRLYLLGDVFNARNRLSPLQIGCACFILFLPFIVPTAIIYLEMSSVSRKIVNRLLLDGYVTARFLIYGTTRAVFLNSFVCVFSPAMMGFIFVVRRKLIMRIELMYDCIQNVTCHIESIFQNPSEKRHHESIARALTYQMLLPCLVVLGTTLWLLDLTEIWTSEIAERLMVITEFVMTTHDTVHLALVSMLNTLAVYFNIYLIVAIELRTPKTLRSYAVFLFAIHCSICRQQFCSLWEAILHDHEALHTILVQISLVIRLLSFAYRLYLLGGGMIKALEPLPPLKIGLICAITFLPFVFPTAFIYLQMTTASQRIVSKLHLEAYNTLGYDLFDTARAIVVNGSVFVFSPLVMTFIFFVRRKLLRRIQQANPSEKRHHESFTRALTYQMFLPCGVTFGVSVWLLDLMDIWTSELGERLVMITYLARIVYNKSDCVETLSQNATDERTIPDPSTLRTHSLRFHISPNMKKGAIWRKEEKIRLRIIFGVANAFGYALARIALLAHQYFGDRNYLVNWYLILATVQKEVFLSYMVILISVLAFDRWIATKYWAWYDRNNRATIGFFIAQEALVHIVAYYFVTSIATTSFFAFCAIAYTAIHRHNSRELEAMKMKSDTVTYSVSRSRQIKENITLLRLFKKVALPLICCSLPAFGLAFLYIFIPPNIGFDTFRHVCVALNDVWLSLSCALVISRIALLERKIVRYLLRMSIDEKHLPSQERGLEVATETYFDMLKKEWQ
uniref:G protein-coupled receptor n=1 Tax=Pristionchus pacificus TaxID=54126 RepID=A0A8R1YXK6_PRIPA